MKNMTKLTERVKIEAKQESLKINYIFLGNGDAQGHINDSGNGREIHSCLKKVFQGVE